MYRQFADRLASELRQLARAPIVFIAAIALAAVVASLAVRSRYARRIGDSQNAGGRSAALAAALPLETHPRSLTAKEKRFLVKALLHAPHPADVYLIEPVGDPAAIRCMKDLGDVLKRAGWNAHNGDPKVTPEVGASFWRAIPGFVLLVNGQNKTPGAKRLADAMAGAGFAVRLGSDPRLADNMCELVIGTAPGKPGS